MRLLVIACLIVLSPLASQASELLDLDNDGEINALTDGLLFIRSLFGFSGEALTQGAVSSECSRCSALDIEGHINTVLQAQSPETLPSYNRGDILLKDANGVALGVAEAESRWEWEIFSLRIPQEDRKNVPRRKYYVWNHPDEYVETAASHSSSSAIYFTEPDCTGTIFIPQNRADLAEVEGVFYAPPSNANYENLLFKSSRTSSTVNSSAGVKSSSGSCVAKSYTIDAVPAEIFVLPNEVINASYPVYLEQQP